MLASSSGLEIPEWKFLGIYGTDELELLKLISLSNFEKALPYSCVTFLPK